MNRENFCQFQGQLCKDPITHQITRTDKEGNTRTVEVCNFVLSARGGRDGNSDEVYFVKCEVWDSAARVMSDFRKGDILFVQGNMKNNKWTDKTTGVERKEDVLRVCHFIPVFVKEDSFEQEPLAV